MMLMAYNTASKDYRKSEAGIDSQLEQKDIRPMSHVNGRACRLRSM